MKEKRTKSKKINYSDIPELSKAQLKSMKRVGRPPLGSDTKLLIAIRIDPSLLDTLRLLAKKKGTGYQTLIHQILENYMDKKAA